MPLHPPRIRAGRAAFKSRSLKSSPFGSLSYSLKCSTGVGVLSGDKQAWERMYGSLQWPHVVVHTLFCPLVISALRPGQALSSYCKC